MDHPGSARWFSRAARAVSLLLALGIAASPSIAQARKAKRGGGRTSKKAPPRPKIVPNQEGKVVLFPFQGDEDQSIAALVERLLRSRGLEVMTGVRPVDTAEQYRELAGTLGLVGFVDGTVKEGSTNARVAIRLRSGYTGRPVAKPTFNETKLHLRAEIEEKLWTKLGPPIARACVDATKPRKRGRGPLMIEAGTPIADGDGRDP
jgi:hypothetical protein